MGLLGLAALSFALARLGDRRTAIYATVVLATMPAWFVHGQASTDLMVPLTANTLIFAGLAVALLDRRAPSGVRALAVVSALGGVALGAGGHVLASAAGPPAIAVGVVAIHFRPRDAAWPGALGVLVGSTILVTAGLVVARPTGGTIANALVGIRSGSAPNATFDGAIGPLAYGLLPWSPLAAIAFGRRPRTAIHFAAVIAAALGWMVHTALAARISSSPLVGIAPTATCIAFAISEVDRVGGQAKEPPGALLPLTLFALGSLVAHDIALDPSRVLAAFGAHAIPASHLASSAKAVRLAVWLTTALSVAALTFPRRWLVLSRGSALALAGAIGGIILRVHAYPLLRAPDAGGSLPRVASNTVETR